MANERYNFKYLPLVGKLPGKSMVEQTETAINELASVVYDNVGHVGNLAEEVQTANTNASNALDKATEALETSGRVYIKQIAAVDVNDYYDSELYYINNDGSTNIPVRDRGFLEVKTNDDKTACEQVFIADSTGTPYYRHGRITKQTLGEETTYVVTWSSWYRVATTEYVQAELQDYLPLSGGTLTGDVDITGDLSVSGDLDVRSESVAPVNTLQRSTAYSVDDIVYTSALNAKYYLLCVTAGITSATMPSFSGAGSNTEVTDGTVVWRVQTITSQESVDSKSGLPVGFEAFTTNPTLQAGWLPLLGGEYSRTTYADLWAWVQTQQGYLIEESAWQAKAAANGGNVPFYSKGDGSTTFRVPALKCWVRGANSINEVGGYLAAGLPNITGGFDLRPVDGGRNVTWETNNGAIKVATQTGDSSTCVASSSSKAPLMNVTIDASRSSAIYGKSDTVQPESIVGLWLVKAYGTVTNVGSTDVSAIAQGLTEAETRISTAAPTGLVQAFAGRTTPQGWLLCDGSAVSRTTYASLYACIGTTYGSGNGSTTFNLPNLVDKFVEGSATAGTVKSAGLPNITGMAHALLGPNSRIAWDTKDTSSGLTGPFYADGKYGDYASSATSGGGALPHNLHFDASRSSAIYGNSNTVQPPALTMRYIIKY